MRISMFWVAVISSALAVGAAAADTLNVPGDYPTIQAALDSAAVAGDEIVLSDPLYAGIDNVDLDFLGKNVLLRSTSGDPSQCTIDCGGTAVSPHRAILFDDGEGAGAIVEGITFTGAWAASGGAVQITNGSPTIRDCVISANNSAGISVGSGSSVTLETTQIDSSTRAGINLSGGGSAAVSGSDLLSNGAEGILSAGGGTVTVTDTDIRGNAGDGISVAGAGAVLDVAGSLIVGNAGSGVATGDAAINVSIATSTISGNAAANGGGVAIGASVTATIDRTIIWDNCAAGSGPDLLIDLAATSVQVGCSILDPTGVSGSYTQVSANVGVSPRFCAPVSCLDAPTTAGTFTVEAASPALAANSPCGQGIGARGQGCAAGCSPSTTSLGFGSVDVGQSAQQTFSITNTGLAELAGTVAASCTHFSVSQGAGGYSLANGESLDVEVTYSPAAEGAHACVISTGGSCENVDVTGTGVGVPTCEITPAALDFGSLTVGDSAQDSVTIKNTGDGLLTGSVGIACTHFSLTQGSGPFALVAGDSVVVGVLYEPLLAGAHACAITTGTNCSDVDVSGSATNAPACSVTPAALAFGSVAVGSSSQRMFTIKNTGGGTLLGTVAESCPDFAVVAGAGSYALGAGDSLVVTVEFTPVSVGATQCDVGTGAGCLPVDCTGIGENAPVCQVSSAVLDFGTVTVGNFEQRAFTIKNSGGGIVSGTVAETCAHYSVIKGEGPFAIVGGDSVVVTVTFAPTVVGQHLCTISTGTSCVDVECSGTAQSPPNCVVSSTSLDFGNVPVGSSAERSFTIRNTGDATLIGDVTEDCDAYQIISGGGQYAIASGDSLVVTVQFAPGVVGQQVCSISTGTSCADVSCTGAGEQPSVCGISPVALDFGTVSIGNGVTDTFRIRNNGGGVLSGNVVETCSHYTITGGGGPFALAGGDSVVVSVLFSPSAVGTHLCTIETGTECADVPCTGIGQLPAICTVMPTTLDFGTVTVGNSNTLTYTIRNDGGGTLNGNVVETCNQFAITGGGGPFALTSGDSVVVSVAYTPTTAADHVCEIDNGTSCQNVDCSGTGANPPDCAVIPSSIDFGDVPVGASEERTFTIKNTGGGPLVGTVSESCADYSITDGAVYALAPGDSTIVTVLFEPTIAGTRACTLITSSLCVDVTCTGEAIGPVCEVTPSALLFGNVQIGQVAQRSFTVKNTGGGTLNGTLSETCSDFTIISPPVQGFALGGGDSVVVTVEFAPSIDGTQQCVIGTGGVCEDVTGIGTGELLPECTLSATSIDFGTIPVNTFVDQFLTIKNTGGGILSGDPSLFCAHFSIPTGGGIYNLAAGDSVNVRIRYAPTSAGEHTCLIDPGSSCVEVLATGVAEPAPVCDVSAEVLDFGVVSVGDTVDRQFDIVNNGGGLLSGALTETCPHYSIIGPIGYNLGPGQSRTFTVRFSPSVNGTHVCTINTGAACADVDCTGRGIIPAECAISDAALDFGNVTIGGTAQRTFTIENTGGGTLSGSIDAACSDFTILSGGGPYVLAGGESKIVTIEFAPVTVGASNCTVTTGTECVDVVCSGIGEEPPECTLSTTSIDFGVVTIGQFAELPFTIENTGGGVLAGTVTELCAPFSIESGAGPFALGTGEVLTVTIRFTPTSTDNEICTVETGTACSNVALSGIGEAAPQCTLSTETLDFGSVAVGSSSEGSVVIENTGGGVLVGNVSLSCEHFDIADGGGAYALASGETQKVTIRYVPTAVGTHACSVDMGTDCAPVQCDGVATPPSECLLSTTTISFGTVMVGESVDRTFSIENTGGGTLVGSITISCEHFQIVSGGGAFALAGGETHDVTVRYEPTASGSHSCTIETGTECASVECTGAGEAPPTCAVTPTQLDFGTVEVGDFATRTFEIVNSGGGLLIGNVSEGCQEYDIISGNGGYALFAGQTRSVTVRFSPSTPGEKTCNVQTGTDCADAVMCTGTGESPPACTVSTTSLDFGTVPVDSTAARTFTITNTGGGMLLGDVTESCASFAVTAGSGMYALGPGESVNVTVEFTPTALGPEVCTIETGIDCPSVTAGGVGGNLPDCEIDPELLDFGVVDVGSINTGTIVLRNNGQGTLSDPVGINASCTYYSILAGGGPYTIAPGDSVVVTVRYAPTVAGQHECIVETGQDCPPAMVVGFAEVPPEPISVEIPDGEVRVNAFQILSLPIAFQPQASTDPTMSTLFDDVFGEPMGENRWLGSTVVGSETIEDPVLKLGRGFWLRTRRAVPEGYEVSGELQSSAVVPLEPGWNIIGAANTDSVALAALRVRDAAADVMTLGEAYLAGILSGSFFDYRDTSGDRVNDGEWVESHVTDQLAHIRAWRGRLVYAYEPIEMLYGFAPPPVARHARPLEGGDPGADWEIALAASSDDLVDRDVTVGVSDSASVFWDRFDVPHPPLPGPGLTLAIDHRGAFDRPDLYRRSLVPPGQPYEWQLVVRGAAQQVTLTWRGLEALPAELDAYLILPDSLAVPMRDVGSYTLATQAGDRDLSVLVTSKPYDGPVLDADPGGLSAVFPMPYSSDVMRIRYRVVTEASSATMRAYDAQGRMVRNLGDVPRTVGEWEILWDGRDDSGKPIGSGLYFIRLELDRRTFTIHQVVVR